MINDIVFKGRLYTIEMSKESSTQPITLYEMIRQYQRMAQIRRSFAVPTFEQWLLPNPWALMLSLDYPTLIDVLWGAGEQWYLVYLLKGRFYTTPITDTAVLYSGSMISREDIVIRQELELEEYYNAEKARLTALRVAEDPADLVDEHFLNTACKKISGELRLNRFFKNPKDWGKRYDLR